MSLEDSLRRALRREEPSAGFADRTLARLSEGAARGRPPSEAPVRRRPPARWIAAGVAASLVVATMAGRLAVRRQSALEGERARRQVELALRIARDTLDEVRTKVEASTRSQF